MTLYGDWQYTAANMLSHTDSGNPELIHPELIAYLHDIDGLCRCVGAELFSRQGVAIAIANWRLQNREAVPYVEHVPK